MDAFEQVVSEIPGTVGLWVRTSINVELTPKQKALIGRPTSPRWELDIVAYSGLENLLYAVERKSYLNSRRVHRRANACCFGKGWAGPVGLEIVLAAHLVSIHVASEVVRVVI